MLLLFIFILFPASCLSTKEKAEYETNQKFIYMYDNCPNETSAKLAVSAIKSSEKGYKGVTTYNLANTPAEDNIENVTKYYDYCKNIKTAITPAATAKIPFNSILSFSESRTFSLKKASFVKAVISPV